MCADERDRIEAAANEIAAVMENRHGMLRGVGDSAREAARAALAAADAVPAGAGEAVNRYEEWQAHPEMHPAAVPAGEAEPQKWTGAEVLRSGRPVGEAVNPYRTLPVEPKGGAATARADAWDEGFRAAAGVAEELAAALERIAATGPVHGLQRDEMQRVAEKVERAERRVRDLEAVATRLYLLLALFDTRDGSRLADLVMYARLGWEMDGVEDDAWVGFDGLWARYSSEERTEMARALLAGSPEGKGGGS